MSMVPRTLWEVREYRWNRSVQHVLPTLYMHLHDFPYCSCGALKYMQCPECGGKSAGCWRCRRDVPLDKRGDVPSKGLVPCGPGDRATVMIHEFIFGGRA